MNLPPDGAMLTLLALWTGEGIEVRDGGLVLTLPDGTSAPVPPAVLDTLEDRGLVEVTEAGAVATDKAQYALDKWVTQRARARGVRGNVRLRSARVGRAGTTR